jgi:hypothetical protein
LKNQQQREPNYNFKGRRERKKKERKERFTSDKS